MSRIGKMPVTVPSGVDIDISGTSVTVKGTKGQLFREFPDRVAFEVEGDVITVTRPDDMRETRALHGLSRALLANMVTGVSEGFTKELEIQGVGYRASLKGSDIELLVGFSENASMGEISALLKQVGAVVIDGPRAGLYRLRLVGTGEEGREAAIEALQQSGVVTSVLPGQ